MNGLWNNGQDVHSSPYFDDKIEDNLVFMARAKFSESIHQTDDCRKADGTRQTKKIRQIIRPKL